MIISNGFGKFHLAVAAEEMVKHGRLRCLITGAYPTLGMRRLLTVPLLKSYPKLARLRDRLANVPAHRISPLFAPEIIHKLGLGILSMSQGKVGQRLAQESMRLYGLRASMILQKAGLACAIYHYRAGFGRASVRRAQRLGMLALADHSLVHPADLDYIVSHNGQFPSRNDPGLSHPDPLWRDILRDIHRADSVLVNSDFVRESFVGRGWDPSRIHTVYLGVDDEFLRFLQPTSKACHGPLHLLFAGAIERRKGIGVLLEALRGLEDDIPWQLEIAGPNMPESRGFNDLLEHPRVRFLGHLSRLKLAARMAEAEVFIFPSLAEGSARVVFEALAAGCYVITTPNSGSIVQDGIQGALVRPGDPSALRQAVRHAYERRAWLHEVGRRNSKLVRNRYSQDKYGSALMELYNNLMDQTWQRNTR